MEDKNYLTKEKYEELEKELLELKTVRRKEIAEKLEYAKSLGDLSENSEYQEARESQNATEERIAVLENLLKSAEIVSTHAGDTIGIGSTISIRKNGSEQTFTLVGAEEANIREGKISNRSPLGDALLGKKKGDVVVYEAPSGTMECVVLSVK
ncbi:MAG: transcription elongation factor GreA [Parcubacteria group bacterium]|nr:transcription elongation factor GreA [Parcubacteria group bacterium]